MFLILTLAILCANLFLRMRHKYHLRKEPRVRTKNTELLKAIVNYVDRHYEQNRKTPTIDEIAQKLNMYRATVQRYLVELDNKGDIKYYGKRGIETKKIAKMKGSNINVALVGTISCGNPIFAEENVEEYFSLPESLVGKGRFFLLRAEGDSMVDAGINQGDLVLIQQQNYANSGDIVVALCEDSQATLKRFYPQPKKKRIRLHPENSRMKDIY